VQSRLVKGGAAASPDTDEGMMPSKDPGVPFFLCGKYLVNIVDLVIFFQIKPV